MWLIWYYRGIDRSKTLVVDHTAKKITLGALVSGVLGFIAGTLSGSQAWTRGFDLESATLIAGFGGLLAPWVAHKIINNSYDLSVKVAQSRYFSDVLPGHQSLDYLPPESRFRPSGGRQKGMVIPMESEAGITAQEYEINRRSMLALLARAQTENRLSQEEVAFIHRLLPQPYDVGVMQQQVLALEQKQVTMTVGERMNYTHLIISYQNQVNEMQEVINDHQEMLKRHEQRYEPQSRIIRDAAFGIGGFIFRWLISIMGGL